ncbi:dITP/XTP pyrophosphatase [Desulfovibrionales bacterium]
MQTIMLATDNQSKVAELSALLVSSIGFSGLVLGLSDFPNIKKIKETGVTFAQNARIKAEIAFAATGLLVVADDSGLEVDALGGAPGVYSARYAGVGRPRADAANNEKLLGELAGLPPERRGGCFVCATVAVGPYGFFCAAEGRWEGRILTIPRGKGGFGYDSLFLDEELGLTAAEMSLEQKNSRSHRGRAFRMLFSGWTEFFTWAMCS